MADVLGRLPLNPHGKERADPFCPPKLPSLIAQLPFPVLGDGAAYAQSRRTMAGHIAAQADYPYMIAKPLHHGSRLLAAIRLIGARRGKKHRL